MANLKIFTANNSANPPGRVGYINVATEILKQNNYLEFIEADPGERADLLNTYAGAGASGLYVQHEYPAGASEKIDNTNCKVIVDIDALKFKKRSRHTMSFPATLPANVNYLQPYVDAIVALNATTPADARRFLFGVMLLTRCR